MKDKYLENFILKASREELVDELRKSAALLKINELISSSLNVADVLKTVLAQALILTEAGSASIFLINSEKQCLEFAATTDDYSDDLKNITVPIGKGISGFVAQTGELVNLADVQNDTRFYSGVDQQTGNQTKSYLCVALRTQGEIIGTTQLMNKAGGNFTDSDERVMMGFANLSAIAIEKALLHEKAMEKERLEKENLRMRTELDVAKKIQSLVLPLKEELIRCEGLEVAARMETATEVGGDFYEVLPYEDGSTYFAIGDVTDHGLASGLVMLMVQAAFRTAITRKNPNLQEVLKQINTVLFGNVQTRMKDLRNMTLTLLRHRNGSFTLTGYHESILVYRKKSDRIEEFDTSDLGIYVGMLDDMSAMTGQSTIKMHTGDIMLLYTDGSVEAENNARELFGIQRLQNSLLSRKNQNCSAIVNGIVDDVYAWIGDAVVYDDITLLVIRRTT